MSTNEDETLAAVAADAEIEDTTVAPLPEEFDWDAFLDGVRPTRRGVRIYPHADLIARMEVLADRIESTPEGENVDDLLDEFEALKEQYREGVWFEVERRSGEWIDQFRADIAKRHGLNLGTREKDHEDADPKDATEALLHQLAAQIVTPAGVTFEHLKRMVEANEGEVNKLVVALQFANQQLAQKAAVLSVDFSQRRSKNRAQRRSSKR